MKKVKKSSDEYTDDTVCIVCMGKTESKIFKICRFTKDRVERALAIGIGDQYYRSIIIYQY